jgi:hypothetical protein
MPLKPNQKRTGHLDEDSPNNTERTGRSDGTEGQRTSGHKTEADYPTGPNDTKVARPFRPTVSNRGEDLARAPEPEVTRADSVHEVGEDVRAE